MESNGEKTEKAKKFYKKWWFWVLAIFVLYVIGSSTETTPTRVSETGDDEVTQEIGQTEQSYNVGDSVELGDSIVTVNEIQVSTGGQFSSPQPGNQWVNLNITIENTDSSQKFITTMGQMFVRDSEGNSYQVAVTDKIIESPNNSLDGAIIANSKRTGWVGFEVPQDAVKLQFQYNGSIWGGKTIVVDIDS